MSVTAATGRGVAGLVNDAERGEDIIVERHGRAVAAVISVEHFEELHRVRTDLTAAALVLARELTDSGDRTDGYAIPPTKTQATVRQPGGMDNYSAPGNPCWRQAS